MNELWSPRCDEDEAEEEQERISKKDTTMQFKVPSSLSNSSTKKIVQLTFGGCGGLYNYFLGVASTLQKEFDLDNVVFSGVSAGCFPAMLCSLGIDIKKEFQAFNFPLLEEARSYKMRAFYRWIPIVRKHTLNRLDPDAYKQANGKFYCSITRVPFLQNELVSYWESNEDMVDCMLASGYVSVYGDSLTYSYRGKRYIDGGISNSKPIPHVDKPSKILQVNEWRFMPLHWFLVSTCEKWATELFEWGEQDALDHLHEFEHILTKKTHSYEKK